MWLGGTFNCRSPSSICCGRGPSGSSPGPPPIRRSVPARSSVNSSTTLHYPPGIGNYRTYGFGFDASWELDIFGGNRREEQAADATVGAAIEDRRAILPQLVE